MIAHVMKRIKILPQIAAVLLVCILAVFTPLQALAAASVTISGDTDIKSGETCTVTVTFHGEDLGRVDAQMTYNDSVLSYLSGGTSKGDTGYIELKDAGTGEDLSFKIKFKGVGSGSSDLQVTTNGMYNLEEEFIDAPSASGNITVKVDAEPTTKETTEPEETTEPSTTEPTEPTEQEEIPQDNGIPFNTIILFGGAFLLLVLILLILILIVSRKGKK